LKSLPLTSAQLSPGQTYNDGTAPAPLTGSFKTLAFNRSYTVTTVADPNGNYLRIDYVVTWNDGVSHSLPFYTIRSQ
jgi:hypothetical protein